MKALSILQPWASLIALGQKRIETRSWSTDYRGPLAIHASKGLPSDWRHIVQDDLFLELIESHNLTFDELPRGCVVATCQLLGVELTTTLRLTLSDQELELGDFSGGRYGWMLSNVQMLPDPVPAKGNLGLWQWVQS